MAKLEWRKKLIASPIGSFSLSGVQVKVSAINVDWPWMVCTGCGHESEGKSE